MQMHQTENNTAAQLMSRVNLGKPVKDQSTTSF